MTEEWRGPEAWIKPLNETLQRIPERMADCLLRFEIALLLGRGHRQEFAVRWPPHLALPCRLALEQWQN